MYKKKIVFSAATVPALGKFILTHATLLYSFHQSTCWVPKQTKGRQEGGIKSQSQIS